NSPCSRDESHRDCYNFVSRTDIEATQSQMERARAAVQADTMINSAIRCEFRLEIRRRLSLGEARRLTNLLQCPQQIAAQRPILLSKVQIRYSFQFSLHLLRNARESRICFLCAQCRYRYAMSPSALLSCKRRAKFLVLMHAASVHTEGAGPPVVTPTMLPI